MACGLGVALSASVDGFMENVPENVIGGQFETRATSGNASAAAAWKGRDRAYSKWLIGWMLLLAIGFGGSLVKLAQFALGSELFSYILLIPFVSIYLGRYGSRHRLVSRGFSAWIAAIPLAVGVLVLGAYGWVWHTGGEPTLETQLTYTIFGFVCLLAGGAFLFLPGNIMRQWVFAVCFLVFLVPIPAVWVRGIEGFLQHRSADVAHALFALSGTPVLREGTVFHLPGFTLEVAPECSGIHSTLVLFITSLVAGYLLLQNRWRRTFLTFAVIPLALLRNGFRIFTIGELCVHVSPEMINSYIHRKGGPIFFALSLIPLFLFLVFLRKGDSAGPGLARAGSESRLP